jgi:hypothetical protein
MRSTGSVRESCCAPRSPGRSAVALGALLAALAGCSSDDASRGDAGALVPCDNPGEPCHAHDPCAIRATCGADGLCRAESFQNCDDDLPCTDDVCEGQGKCSHLPQPGWCALSLAAEGGGTRTVCLEAGARDPDDACRICDPAQSRQSWSGATGGDCDDGKDCTKNDYCQQGRCSGTFYDCSDTLECTADKCDGLGGCSNDLQPGWCRIDETCHADGAADATGCNRCDAKQDPTAWTPLEQVSGAPRFCTIRGRCYLEDKRDATGCGVCDPDRDEQAWSTAGDTCVIDGKCLIGGECHDQSAISPSQCGVCDTAAPRVWSARGAATTLVLDDFEGNDTVFQLDDLVDGVGWQVSSRRAHDGGGSLYYGSASTSSYDNGAANSGTALGAPFTLPAGQRAALIFWLYLDVESAPDHDRLTISAGGQLLWSKKPQTLPDHRYRRWTLVEVDLSSLAGQSDLRLAFEFDTADDWSNGGEGVYLDEMVLLRGCGAL